MGGRGGPPGTPAAVYGAETWSEAGLTVLEAYSMLWAPRPAFRGLRLDRASATSARASPTFFDFAGPVPTAASPEATIAPMSAARMRDAWIQSSSIRS